MRSQNLESISISRVIVMVFAIGILITGCSGTKPATDVDRAAVYEVVEQNAYYLAVENLDGVMWTIHEDSPGRVENKALTQSMFDLFDLSYSIVDWEINSISSETAKIRIVQVTRKKAGAEPFRDNQIEAVHTLKKNAEGQWKIYSTDVGEIEYLEN